WYTFLRAQRRVSRRLDRVMTVSEASASDLHRDYGIARERLRNVGNGIAVDVFRPHPEIERKPNRLITTLSADQPLKGFPYLVEALALLRRDRPDLVLTVIGRPGMKTDTRKRIEALGLEGAIEFT